MRYFNVKQSIEAFPEARTYILVGTRGVGKSYSPEVYCLEDAIFRGRQFCLVGRYKEDVMPSTIANTFNHMTTYNEHTGSIPLVDIISKAGSKVPDMAEYSLESKAGQIWLVGRESDEERWQKILQVGVYAAVQTAERFKRGSYPAVYNIFFDEFITARWYIGGSREPVEFEKIVNTIFRHGKNGKIFMAGNPDNEIDMCPYLVHYNIFYDDMESNVIYPCNDDKVAFIKLTNEENADYIVRDTVSMFGVDNSTAFTGEVDRPKQKRIPKDFSTEFDAIVEMRVETSGIMAEGTTLHRRCFFLYVGLFRGELWAVTNDHHKNYGEPYQIVCKYDINELPPPDEAGQITYVYRFQFPQDLKMLGQWLAQTISTGRIYHETDKTANILRNLIAEQ